MENNLTANGSGLDRFLSTITTNVVRNAIEKVSDQVVEMYDEESLLEHLDDESFKESVIETSSIYYPDLPEFKSNEISNAYVCERCSKLVEDTCNEVYDELCLIFDSNSQEMSNDIESSKKKLHSLDCIKSSDCLQHYFQELSLSIIQNTFEKIRIAEGSKHLENEPYLASNMESDIENLSTNTQQGSESIVKQNFSNNIDKYNSAQNFDVEIDQEKSWMKNENQLEREDENEDSNIESGQTKDTSGSSGFTTANSTMYQTTEVGESYNEQLSNQDSFFSMNNETQGNGNTTIDSAMFTTADDFKENLSESTFLSFEKEMPQETTITQSSPGRIVDRRNSDIDTTLIPGPRQSTPLVNDMSNDHEISLPSTEASNIFPEDSQHGSDDDAPCQSTPLKDNKSKDCETSLPSVEESDILSDNMQHDMTEYDRTMQEFSGDESSVGDPSSPRTLSRQSSAFGNVTLEFDTDWEASMKGLQDEAGMKSKPEEKHKVILHELSFEDHHRLKAPELLCPVFLAVQDDDDDDEFGGEERKRQRMSQSIDDLCEMISEDSDDDQDLPLRRRAMSLERKKPPAKEQRKKALTREELMAAFAELQHEIMEEKDSEQEGESVGREEGMNEEDEEQNGTPGGEIMDNQEYNGLNDPLRWHTVVFNGQHKVIDLKLLEPFLKVLTHGGYHHEGDKKTVIVVLTACNLPNKKMKRYPFLMEQLFFFIISTMDLLVTSEEYIFVYFHGGTSKNQSPSFSWLKKYYQYIDHRLRKSVTKVYVVHPNLWLKSVFRLWRPFLSSNFARKLKFVNNLKELSSHIKTDFIFIPDEVIRVDPDYRKLHAS